MTPEDKIIFDEIFAASDSTPQETTEIVVNGEVMVKYDDRHSDTVHPTKTARLHLINEISPNGSAICTGVVEELI